MTADPVCILKLKFAENSTLSAFFWYRNGRNIEPAQVLKCLFLINCQLDANAVLSPRI